MPHKKRIGLSQFLPGVAITSVLGILAATLSSQALAGHYEFAKESRAEGLEGSVTDPDACNAFLRNLRKFENLPYGMACRRELDPGLGFTRPIWEKLDIPTHVNLAIAIFQYAHWEYRLPSDPALWESRVKEMAQKENLTMELTRLDLKGDGKLKNLVRFGFGRPCNPVMEIERSPERANRHRRLFVIDESLSNVDPMTDKGFSTLIDDVFLYKGKVYSDRFWPRSLALSKGDAVLTLMKSTKYGVADVCTFIYSK